MTLHADRGNGLLLWLRQVVGFWVIVAGGLWGYREDQGKAK